MLRVEGVFPSACRLWDTPGVKHHYQLSSKLNPDEVLLIGPVYASHCLCGRTAVTQATFVEVTPGTWLLCATGFLYVSHAA